MPGTKPCRDPDGSNILLSGKFLKLAATDAVPLTIFEQTLSNPDYMIERKGREITYIKLIANNINVLITAKRKEDSLVASRYILNPTEEDISKLLKGGHLRIFEGGFYKARV